MRKEVEDARTRARGRQDAEDSFDPEGELTHRRTSGGTGDTPASPLVAASRPRVKPSVDVFTASDGAIYLMHPSADDLMIKSPPTGVATLLKSLDGTRTRDGIIAELSGLDDLEVESALAQLWTLGLLEDAREDGGHGLPPCDLERYSRQLAYFAELAPAALHREALQARLAGAQVAVLGLGGLGCWTAMALACTGIGRLLVVDGDAIELTNLNRQMLYTPADIGLGKADVWARALRSFNPSIDVVAVSRRLESKEEVAQVVEGSDVIVELADWPVGLLSRWIAGAANTLGVPHLQASQDPPIARVGPTFIPRETACAECQAHGHRERHELYDELIAFRSQRAEESATFGPACAIIGGVLANEVTNVLLGLAPPATAGRAAMVDLRTLEWTWEDPVVRQPGCVACAASAAPTGR